jgi:hypothetical protein
MKQMENIDSFFEKIKNLHDHGKESGFMFSAIQTELNSIWGHIKNQEDTFK